MLRNLVSVPMAKLAACAVLVTACEQAADPLLSTTAPPTREELAPYFFGTYGTPVLIQLPQGVTYDPNHSYVTAPNTETVSNIAEIATQPHSGVVEVLCLRAGDVWVKVFTTTGYWKIYPLTCLPPALDGTLIVPMSEEPVFFEFPDRIFYAHLDQPYGRGWAFIPVFGWDENQLVVQCAFPRELWLRVTFENGDTKWYWFICHVQA
jgi:hypothetical protein